MRVVQRLGAVAVDAQDRYVRVDLHGYDAPCPLLWMLTGISPRPKEDVKIYKARTM
ncbi:hypothetical protein EV363DRAFT_1359772 [Boletus edulis]|nr:hypothetical protein EV363DRAFT_1359772 [Boletus edulis]